MDSAKETPDTNELSATNDTVFQAEIESLISKAEEGRLQKMRNHRDRAMINTTVTLLLICIGSAFFGWFFLVSGDPALAFLSLICTIIPPVFLSSWAHEPIRKYRTEYKSKFMPDMAKALGGLKFYPKRGISKNILSRTGVVPAHKEYRAEDFFMGNYRGARIMISEARLTHPQKLNELSFHGVFVLIEAPQNLFPGHTVLCADKAFAAKVARKLKPVTLPPGEYTNLFSAFSSNPQTAETFIKEQMVKEFAEMHELFKKSPLRAAFFKGKYIFVMIPYDEDMFEASNIFVPVTTSDAAMRCKREIEQIMSIIDVLDHLNPVAEETVQQAAPEPEPVSEEE